MATDSIISVHHGRVDEQVLCHRYDSGVLHLILNRPNKLNSLTLAMVQSIRHYLRDEQHSLVLMSGSGRAFCAGGDVQSLAFPTDVTPQSFLSSEYALDEELPHHRTPIVVVLHGACMGGGLGIGLHSSHAVVTSSVQFAMPECAIGLLPDVGASQFLSAMPGYIGLYLGMTGATIDAANVIYTGAVTHFSQNQTASDLIKSLQNTHLTTNNAGAVTSAALSAHISQFTSIPPAPTLAQHRRTIDSTFNRPSVDSIMQALATSALTDDWAQTTLDRLRRQCPNSLLYTFTLFHRARRDHWSVADALRHEYRLCIRSCQHADGDLQRGVRTVLIDKQKNIIPLWKPLINTNELEHMLLPLTLDNDGVDDLSFVNNTSKL